MQDSQVPALSVQPAAANRRRSLFLRTSDLRPRISRRAASRRQAFTLTELLIVIAIIAVLAALSTAAAINALRAARRGGIVLDIKNISGAVENFKNDYGAYPPNAINPAPNGGTGSPSALAQSDMERMFKKAFPRHQEPRELILALCGQGPSGGPNLQNGMTASEALVFWMGGFSADEQYPISGSGGPSFLRSTGEVLEDRNRRYEFDLGRLGPRNDNGTFAGNSLQYQVIINGTTQERQINFWEYRPKGSEQPLVYFDTSRHKPVKYDMGYTPAGSTNKVYALKKLREGFSGGTPAMTDYVFVDPKFQILHAGLDDDWGSFGLSATDSGTNVGDLAIFPDGPFIGPNADTLTNFTNGEIADEAE